VQEQVLEHLQQEPTEVLKEQAARSFRQSSPAGSL
jgi:hypothetical protein